MKKLMVLSLVLAVSAVSTAAISLVDLGGGAYGIEGPSGANFTYFLGINVVLDPVAPVLTAAGAAGNLSSVGSVGTFDWFDAVGVVGVGVADTYQVAISGTPPTLALEGIQVTGMTNALGFGDADLGLGGIFLYELETGRMISTLYAIPEPMTMGLLGLGALFLRRRK